MTARPAEPRRSWLATVDRLRRGPQQPPSPERRLLALVPGAGRTLAVAVGCGVGAEVASIAAAIAISIAVAAVYVDGRPGADVTPLLLVAAVAAVARGTLVAAQEVLAQRAASRLVGSLRGRTTAALVALGPAWTSGERTGELATVLGEGLASLDDWAATYLPARWLAVVVPVLVLLVVALLDLPTVAVLLFAGPILVLLLAVIGGRVRTISNRRFLELRWLGSFFLDMLRGIATLKQFGRSREQVETIDAISRRYGETTMEVLRTTFQTSLVLEWGAAVAMALVAVEVSLRLMADSVAFDRALAVLVVTPTFFLPLRQLAARYHVGTAGSEAAARIAAILETPGAGAELAPSAAPAAPTVAPAGTAASAGPAGSAATIVPAGGIQLESVSYAYPGRDRPAVDGLSLTIPTGARLALVGDSGAGKSTVVRLLLRFMEPDTGRIVVGGTDLGTIGGPAWRSTVAWVPQRPHLFDATVADNLRLGRPDATDAELRAAAEAARADEFIARLPRGYNTPLGAGGRRLSGGQRQRLAIARAILRDARLVLLDEPTAHLDPATEREIGLAIDTLALGRTLVVVSHRLWLARSADLVAVLDAGRLVELGTPDDVAASGGPFATLAAAAAGDVDLRRSWPGASAATT
jgi:thiol reductant ABC exporter CydD subunit